MKILTLLVLSILVAVSADTGNAGAPANVATQAVLQLDMAKAAFGLDLPAAPSKTDAASVLSAKAARPKDDGIMECFPEETEEDCKWIAEFAAEEEGVSHVFYLYDGETCCLFVTYE